MKNFTIELIRAEQNGVHFYAKNSVMLMLFQALEHCENDEEKNAIRCLIRGIESLKPV